MGNSISPEQLPPKLISLPFSISSLSLPSTTTTTTNTLTNTAITVTCKSKRYQVLEKIGGGSFGEVYRVVLLSSSNQNVVEKEVALKIVTFKLADRDSVENEVKILELVKSNSLFLQIIDYEFCDRYPLAQYEMSGDLGYLIIVTELCHCTLDDLLDSSKKNSKPIPLNIRMKWAIQMFHALDYLSDKKNIVHRDIKPSNILVSFDTRFSSSNYSNYKNMKIKFADFGLSKSDQKLKTSCGTILYRAFEMIENVNGFYSGKVDVYSMGIVFFQLFLSLSEDEVTRLVGEIVWKGKSAHDINRVQALETALMRMNRDERKEMHRNMLELVEESSVQMILERMICLENERLTAKELLKEPIVISWSRALSYTSGGCGEPPVDDLIEVFSNHERGCEIVNGLLTTIKSSTYAHSLYYLNEIMKNREHSKHEEAYTTFVQLGGKLIVHNLAETIKNQETNQDEGDYVYVMSTNFSQGSIDHSSANCCRMAISILDCCNLKEEQP